MIPSQAGQANGLSPKSPKSRFTPRPVFGPRRYPAAWRTPNPALCPFVPAPPRLLYDRTRRNDGPPAVQPTGGPWIDALKRFRVGSQPARNLDHTPVFPEVKP